MDEKYSAIWVRFIHYLMDNGVSRDNAIIIKTITTVVLLLIMAYIANRITKSIILQIIKKIISTSKNLYDDIFVEKKVFNRLSHIVPGLIIYFGVTSAISTDGSFFIPFVHAIAKIYIIFVIALVINAFLSAMYVVFTTFKIAKTLNIRGYIQVVKIIVSIIGAFLILSVLLNKSPIYFLSGLGALAAVLILVFKDTLLGLTASIQLSANDMAKPGDFITMAKYSVDGIIKEINLTSVKVQNLDKSIVYIPTYTLVSDSFINWKGVDETNARRIKRSFYIDIKSIKFCTNELVSKLQKINVFTSKINELTKDNSQLTNLTIFRNYLDIYLRNNEFILPDQRLLVHQLQPTDMGIPIEIVAFTSQIKPEEFEAVESDIIEHILAAINSFDLYIYQRPSGNDS